MLTALKRDLHQHLEQHQREALSDFIGEQVIGTLGKPLGLFKVQVRSLWDNHHRANVYVGNDATAVTVANSYFLKVDEDGLIVESRPTITKQY
jgi:hypothetical protein